MALESKQLERVFIYKKEELKDIDPTLSENEIMDLYTVTYPELVNAKVEGPKIVNERVEYTFSSSLGTKG